MESNTCYNVVIPAGNEFSSHHRDNYIHCQLLEKMQEQIGHDMDALSMTECPCDYYHSPDKGMNYLFTGKRGCGKSTFLKALVERICSNQQQESDLCSPARMGTQQRRELLCWYDPSESVGGKDYFFLTIAAALKSRLEKALKAKARGECDYECLVSSCKTYMKKLDKGIVRLSNDRRALEDLTPQGASSLRKDNPEFDESIRDNFKKVVDYMCAICQVGCFVVAIDDADTRSEQCFRVLEDLRLYIRHPRLVVLMTGDKNMYLEHIRERLFCEFDIEYHQADQQGRGARMNLVVSHASQYLLKLFPLNNQCELRDLLTLEKKNIPIVPCVCFQGYQANWDKYTVKLTGIAIPPRKEPSYTIPLRKLVDVAFKWGVGAEDAERILYVDQFFRLPLRSILQVVHYWSIHQIWAPLAILEKLNRIAAGAISPEPPQQQNGSSPESSDANSNDEYYKTQEKARNEVAYRVRMALAPVLMSELRSAYYNFDSLHADNGRAYFDVLLRYCQRSGDLEHGYYLIGEAGKSDEEKTIALLLAISFQEQVKSLSSFIQYLLFGPATVSLFEKAITQYGGPVKKEQTQVLIEDFNDYMQIRRGISISRWARHASIVMTGDHRSPDFHAGVVRLDQCEPNNKIIFTKIHEKIGPLVGPPENSGACTSEASDDNESYKLGLALLVSMSKSAEADHAYFISIFNYLAFICKCATICQKNEDERLSSSDTNPNNAILRTSLTRLIRSYLPIKSGLYPQWMQKTEKSPESDMAPKLRWLKPDAHFDHRCEKTVSEIIEWHTEKDRKANVKIIPDLSPHKMGTIWADLNYSMSNIKQDGFNGEIAKYMINVIDVLTKVADSFPAKHSEYYRKLICDFPLTRSLKVFFEDMEKEYTEKKSSTN